MAQTNPDEVARLRRVLPERAIALAMASRWAEAVDVNNTILTIDPNNADAYNRLGKAQLELGNYREAYEAYKRAVELAPGNAIAQKNMNRLAPLAAQPATAARRPTPRTGERINPHAFIEETGKTGLTHLHNLASGPTLLGLTAGDRVSLVIEDNQLMARTESGEYLGQVESKMAHRLMRFMQAGNRYSATVTTVSDKSLSLIIREDFQAPAMAGRQSFPSKGAAAAYRPTGGVSRYGYDEDEDATGDFEMELDSDADADVPEEEAEFEDDDIEDRE
jgi:tetratricopeptide (TPR) repeat protein